MKANVKLEHELLAVEAEHELHAMLEVTSPAAPQTERQPLHIALVIDRSGSMTGEKLGTTKQCALQLVRSLGPEDRLSLVIYDEEVQLLAPLAPVDKQALAALIGGIEAGGSTNLSGGWLKGVETLRGAREAPVRRVLLLTDGLANQGITEPGRLVEMSGGAAAEGIATTTIGFGEGFDEDLLTRMADAGRGSAHFAATPDDAPRIFGQEFEDLLSVVAQNVSVEIRPSDRVEMLGVLNEYPMVAVAGGVQIQLGDAYGDEVRRVVFALRIPGLAELGVAQVAELVIRYAGVGEQVALHETTVPVLVNLVSADEAAAVGPDPEVLDEVVILKAARAQEEARDLADRGDFEGARAGLRSAAEDLRRAAPSSPKAADLLEQAEELGEVDRMMSPAEYAPMVRKQMTYRSHSARRGRRKQ